MKKLENAYISELSVESMLRVDSGCLTASRVAVGLLSFGKVLSLEYVL